MEKQVLSIEQMKELKKLGIDTSKASMCWLGHSDCNSVYPYNTTFRECFEKHLDTIPLVLTPTFTLQDILEMLPRTIKNGSKRLKVLPPNEIEYTDCSQVGHFEHKDSLLNASFSMLRWCKENNYI